MSPRIVIVRCRGAVPWCSATVHCHRVVSSCKRVSLRVLEIFEWAPMNLKQWLHAITLSLVGLGAMVAITCTWAQATDPPAAVVKANAKATEKASSNAKPDAKKSRVDAKNKATQMATGIMAAEAALTPSELLIAERVFVGTIPCEFGVNVTLTPDPKTPGFFDVVVKNFKFRMSPQETSTGAIRLEDKKAGAVWLQLGNKSMMMNQKQGRRLADACASPAQMAVAQALEKNPAPSVLDAPTRATFTSAAPPVPSASAVQAGNAVADGLAVGALVTNSASSPPPASSLPLPLSPSTPGAAVPGAARSLTATPAVVPDSSPPAIKK